MEISQYSLTNGNVKRSEKRSLKVEALKDALNEVRLCSRLEDLLVKKRQINNGDSFEGHSQKVDKLKVLAESLSNSASKVQTRILEHRHQVEEAFNFRVAKANEGSLIEKELVAEIAGLEKQKDELEAELKKVNISLMGALTRLHKTREERDQFDEASNQIILHLKAREDELARSVMSCKLEGNLVHTWINFMEDTWLLQSEHMELKEKQTNEELDKYGECFVSLIKHHLLSCKDELEKSISNIRAYVDNLRVLDADRLEMKPNTENGAARESNSRALLEEEYLESETKILTVFSVIHHMKELYHAERVNTCRGDDCEIKEFFDAIDILREEFESIERPQLEIETPNAKMASSQKTVNKSMFLSVKGISLLSPKQKESPKTPLPTRKHHVDSLVELEDGGSKDFSEFGGSEFDELEEELKDATR